jgi:hypothetical protein
MLAALCLGMAAAFAAGADGLSQRPLGPRPAAGGRTLFTLLKPDETGIHLQNPYDDPRMWGDLYYEFESGSIGTGVAIGDFDGDGRPDIFVATKTHGCRLYRNLGNYRFQDVTEAAGVAGTPGIWNEGVAFVDLFNTGRLDIYVCRFNAPNLLYVNQGDGTFKEMAHQAGLDVVDASVSAAFQDTTGSGRLDVLIQTNVLSNARQPNGRRNYLFRNNGDGTFTQVTDQAGISTEEAHGHSASWWNLSGRPRASLYVANDFSQPDLLYAVSADGTFSNTLDATVPHTPFSSMGSDTGDLRNDGYTDLLVADMAASTREADQRGIADSRSRTVDDQREPEVAPQYERNALYIDTGTGHCLEAANLAGLAATDWTWSTRFEDLDNDGRLDLVVTNGMFRESTNVDLLARQSAAETAEERGRIIRESPVYDQMHLAFRNTGDLAFEDVSEAWGLDQKGVAFGCALGDLSGDGNMDIVAINYEGGVSVLRNDCAGAHSVEVELRGRASNRSGVGAVIRVESALGTQTRTLEVVRGYMSSSEPMAHFGLGPDTVVRRLTVTWPSGHVQTFQSLAADQRFTVTEPAGAPPAPSPAPQTPAPQFEEVSRSLGLSLGSREEIVDELAAQPLLPRRLNRRGPALAAGDIDASGRDGIVLAGTTLDPLRIERRGDPGGFSQADASSVAPGAGVDDGPVLLLDASGHGFQDLLVTRGGNALPAGSPEYEPRLYVNDGRGGFTPARPGALPSFPLSAGAVAAADFDHSGRLGLFLGARVQSGDYPTSPRSTLLANRGGTFEDVTDTLAPGLRNVGMVTAALWSDVDGDGWPDLIVATEWGRVRYFHNAQGKGFEDWTERSGFGSAGTGWWTSLAAADFNGDGRMDYVLGNVGLNTPYRASPERPAVLFYGNFASEGEQPQIVEATYDGDRLYPWRTRRDLAASIPSVLRRYPRNNAYARATLGEILGEDRLARAQRLEATEFRSGVLLSQPDGTYRFAPLPRIAQISPFQGLAAGDFDGDGHADIYAVQNSYAPVPSVGRFDGGLSQLLKGDGRGNFTAVPPASSGLVVPGDAKALAVMDLEGSGWPGFVVTRNNGTVLAFANHGIPGRHSLAVRLHGPPGNPTGVGARVTATYADGKLLCEEVSAGSGYYSQSSPVCFFGWTTENPVRSLRVAWPSGAERSYPVTQAGVSLVLEPSP